MNKENNLTMEQFSQQIQKLIQLKSAKLNMGKNQDQLKICMFLILQQVNHITFQIINYILFEFMGNICCQNEVDKSFIEDNIIKMDQYHPAALPADDNVLNQWFKLNNITLPTATQHSSQKVMKHKQKQRYYYGEWKDGVPEGKGVFYEPNKILFNGNFYNGYPAGPSRIVFIDQKCEFDGELKQGKANGVGTLDNAKHKYKFTGEWKQSKPEKGTLTLAVDKNISSIQFINFSKGRAIINYKDQRRYQGQISTSKLQPHGKGKVQFPYNSRKLYYDGQWANGLMQGKGFFKWTDSQYEGEFLKGKREGYGKFTFQNGNYYQGYWFDGKQEGAGVLYDKQKHVLKKGNWKNGLFSEPLNDENFDKINKQSAVKHQKAVSHIKSEIHAVQVAEKLQSNISVKKEQNSYVYKSHTKPQFEEKIQQHKDSSIIKKENANQNSLNGSKKVENNPPLF